MSKERVGDINGVEVMGGRVVNEVARGCRIFLFLGVTILPRTPQKPSQNNDAAKADDLKRCAHDIARDSHGIEDEIRAMVSSYMTPKDEEDSELAIGRLVC